MKISLSPSQGRWIDIVEGPLWYIQTDPFLSLEYSCYQKKSNQKYKKSAHDTEGMIIFPLQLSGTDISTQADRWRCWEEKARLLRGH